MNRLFRPSSGQGLLQGFLEIFLFVFVLGTIVSGCTATPTPTAVRPTATAVPPSPTATLTPIPPTVPPTATAVPPTATSVPATATEPPTPTVIVPTPTAEISATVNSGDSSQNASTVDANPCLACHKYNELLTLKPKFQVQESTVNPHWFVPHTSRDIPECTSCHEPHATSPLPKGPQDVDMSKVNIEMCFSCHHLQNFTPCKTCHE